MWLKFCFVFQIGGSCNPGCPQTHYTVEDNLLFWSSCLHLWNAGITALWHHNGLCGAGDWILPMELHLQPKAEIFRAILSAPLGLTLLWKFKYFTFWLELLFSTQKFRVSVHASHVPNVLWSRNKNREPGRAASSSVVSLPPLSTQTSILWRSSFPRCFPHRAHGDQWLCRFSFRLL